MGSLLCLLGGQDWASLCLPPPPPPPPSPYAHLYLSHCPVPSLPPVWKEHGCSSSDDDTDVDVEGLRRRRGREPSPPQPMAAVDGEDQAKGEGIGELGISLNMCFLGALVLLGLGILLFSGEYYWLGLAAVSALTSRCFPEALPGFLHLQAHCWSPRLVSRRLCLGFLSGLGGNVRCMGSGSQVRCPELPVISSALELVRRTRSRGVCSGKGG